MPRCTAALPHCRPQIKGQAGTPSGTEIAEIRKISINDLQWWRRIALSVELAADRECIVHLLLSIRKNGDHQSRARAWQCSASAAVQRHAQPIEPRCRQVTKSPSLMYGSAVTQCRRKVYDQT
jgi:hypothetical protein